MTDSAQKDGATNLHNIQKQTADKPIVARHLFNQLPKTNSTRNTLQKYFENLGVSHESRNKS